MNKMIPKGWVKIKLGDIGKFSTSSVNKKSVKGEKEVYLLNYMDVYHHSTITEDYPFQKVTAPRKQVLSSSVQRGDVFFTPSSETPDDIGHSAVFIGDLENIVHSYHTIRFRSVSNEYLDDHFKAYAFKGADTYEYFRKRATGSTRFTLSLPNFNELELTFPSIPEQKKIASIFTSVEKMIKSTQKQINKLQDLKKAMINELLIKGIGHKEFKDSELGRIPKSWEIRSLGDVASCLGGYAFKSEDECDDGVRWLKIANVGVGQIKWNDESFLPKHFSQKHADFILKEDDIVCAMTRPILNGKLKVATISKLDEGALLNQRVCKIKPNKYILSKFLFLILQSEDFVNQLDLAIAGSDPPNVSGKQIEALRIALPSASEQKVISNAVYAIQKRIDCVFKKLIQTQSLKKSLMQVLLTGKVRVKIN
jgi:type I restriction enzyme S subunit